MDSELIGKRIAEARDKQGMTLKELADMVNLSEATISRYENGIVGNIKTPIIESISNILNVNLNWLLGISDVMAAPINSAEKTVLVPLIGQIACGSPILAEENIEDYFAIDKRVKADFCLQAKGDSMIEAGINSGDYVFIRHQSTLENGEIGAVIIDEEATLKRFYKNGNQIILQPANSNYQPIIINDGIVNIAGKLVGVLNLMD